MADIKRMVLDVLKPHDPTMLTMAEKVSDLDSVKGVNAILYEIDESVENIKLTIEGDSIDFDSLKAQVEELGGSIHSVDEAVCGEKIVEEVETPQG